MAINEILRNRRIELGLSMKELAEKVGVSEGTISRWESGKIEDMKRSRIKALADALHISPAVIMGWDDTTLRPKNMDIQSSLFSLSPDEVSLLEDYRELNSLGQEKAREYVEDLKANDKYTHKGEISSELSTG